MKYTESRSLRHLPIIALAILVSAPARAEDCSKYPAGPSRFACYSAKNPGLIEKRDRCRQEANNAGLRIGTGGGAHKGYVQACMQRQR
jgi:hypothetical protein